MTRQGGRKTDEAGSLSVETVMVVPVFLALFSFVLAIGTLQDDRGTMDAAVQAGARAGSLARTKVGAEQSATAAADVVFQQGGLTECLGHTEVKPNDVGAALPQPPKKYINVLTLRGDCPVKIDIGIFSFHLRVTSDFTSVVDAYRGR